MSELSNIWKEMQEGVYDFTEGGECSNCGQCCSNYLPVSEAEIRIIRRYVAKNGIQAHRHVITLAKEETDMACPFRDNTGRRCTIYPVRPAICQDFRCDKPAKEIQADKAMYHGKYTVVDMREEFFG